MSRRVLPSSSLRPVGASQNAQQFTFSGCQSISPCRLFFGVTLDTRLTWSSHMDQVRKTAVQRLGCCDLLNRISGFSFRNDVLLYDQPISLMIDYMCPVLRFPASFHVVQMQVRQSKCLRIANNALCTFVTIKYTRIWESLFYRPHQISNLEIRFKVS
jgi:hypothetical protein